MTKSQIAYIIPAALYNLWLTCVSWLIIFWTVVRLNQDFALLNYVLFYFAHAAGIAVSALWIDKSPAREKLKYAAVFSSVLTCALTASMTIGHGWWLVVISVLSGITAGFFWSYLPYFIFLEIPGEKRGFTIGISFALGYAVNFIIFVLLYPQQEGIILYGKTFFAAAVVLLLGITALLLPVCRNNLWPAETFSRVGEDGSGKLKPGVLILLSMILLCFFLSFGMQDIAATAYWLGGEDHLVYTRIFIIIGFLAGGILCDLKGRYVIMASCFALLIPGFIPMAYQYQGFSSFIGFSCVQMANTFFSVSIMLIFLDMAKFCKKPALICSLSLALPFMLRQTGIIASAIISKTYGNLTVFVAILFFIVAALPLITVLFERIGVMNRQETNNENNPAEDGKLPEELLAAARPADMAEKFARKYGFTKRENQVLELTLHGLSVSEMAQSLSISEPTVKHYIRKILRKTETKNRRELLSLLIKESNLDA